MKSLAVVFNFYVFSFCLFVVACLVVKPEFPWCVTALSCEFSSGEKAQAACCWKITCKSFILWLSIHTSWLRAVTWKTILDVWKLLFKTNKNWSIIHFLLLIRLPHQLTQELNLTDSNMSQYTGRKICHCGNDKTETLQLTDWNTNVQLEYVLIVQNMSAHLLCWQNQEHSSRMQHILELIVKYIPVEYNKQESKRN